MAEISMQKEKKGFAVMAAYPEFFKLFLGQTVSRLGDAIDGLALMWMAYKLTDSPLIMATVMFFNALPSLLFGVFAGVFIDRWDRKKVLILGDLSRGLIVGLIAYLYFRGLMVSWYLFVATFIISTVEVFSSPARTAILPVMVNKEHLMTANSMFNMVSSICEIIGIGIASAIVGVWGIAVAIFMDAISFLFCALMTWLTKIPKLPIDKKELNFQQYRLELREGFQFIRSVRIVFICIVLAAFTNFILAPIGVIFPVFSDKILKAGTTGFALMAASLSSGVLVSSMIMGQFGDRMKKKTRFIQIGIFGIGLGFALLGFAHTTIIAGILCFFVGLSLPVASISFSVLMQQNTPVEKLGRVSAFGRTLTMGGIPLGIMIAGLLSEMIPTNMFFHIVGVIIMAIIGITSLSSEFRNA